MNLGLFTSIKSYNKIKRCGYINNEEMLSEIDMGINVIFENENWIKTVLIEMIEKQKEFSNLNDTIKKNNNKNLNG